MTVAAVLIAPSAEDALAAHEGQTRLARLIDVAWAGGAVPIVVVALDPEARIAQAVRDTPAVIASPRSEPRGIAWFAVGCRAATEHVTETSAALLWPMRFAWLDPETVTSLIEAHGAESSTIVRPAYRGRAGFPALVPVALLGEVDGLRGRSAEEALLALAAAGVPERIIELGDPGIVHDVVTPWLELPPFEGPPGPVGGPPPEWNEALGGRVADG